MRPVFFCLLLLLIFGAPTAALAGDKAPQPILQLDSGGHTSLIRDIAFTPDGNYLVSAGDDKLIRVWDWRAGRTVRTLRGQVGKGDEGKIYAMALSPDGRYLAAGGWTDKSSARLPCCGDIRLYDFTSGRLLALLKGHTSVVFGLAFSPDSRRLISGSGDFDAMIWDTGDRFEGLGDREGALTLSPTHRLKGHTDHIYAVGFVPLHNSASRTGVSPSRDLPQQGRAPADGRSRLAAEDGVREAGGRERYHAVTGSDDHTLRLWEADSGRLLRVMKGHEDKVRSLTVSASGLIASGSWDHTIRLWDGRTGLPVGKAARGRFLAAAVSSSQRHPGAGRDPDGSRSGTGAAQKKARQPASSSTDRPMNGDGRLAPDRSLSSGGPKARPGDRDDGGSGNALSLDVVGGANVLADQGTQVGSLSFSPDGQTLLSGISGPGDNHCHVFDVASGRELLSYQGHDNVVLATAISPDGRFAATGGGSRRQIDIWELPSSSSEAAGQTNKSSMSEAVGRQKKSSNSEAAGQEKATGAIRARLKGAGKAAYAAGFSKTGRRIGWGNTDKGSTNSQKEPFEFALRLSDGERPLGAVRALSEADTPHPGPLPMGEGERGAGGKGDAAAPGEGEPRAEDFIRARARHGDWRLQHRKGGNYGYDAHLDILERDKTVATITRGSTDGYQHRSYTFTPDGKSLISGGGNGWLSAYDLQGGKLGDFTGHTGDVWAVTVSPDGRLLVSGSDDQTVRLWNVKTRELIVTLFHGCRAQSPASRVRAKSGNRDLKRKSGDGAGGRSRLAAGGGVRDAAEGSRSSSEAVARTKERSSSEAVAQSKKRSNSEAVAQSKKRSNSEAVAQSKKRSSSEAVARTKERSNSEALAQSKERSSSEAVAHQECEWAMWTPQGYYTASTNGRGLVGWQLNRGVDKAADHLSGEQLHEYLYSPEIINRAITLGSAEKAIEELGGKRDILQKVLASGMPPEVSMLGDSGRELTRPDITLRAELRERDGGAGKVEWRVNGVTLGVEDRGWKPLQNGGAQLSRSFTLAPGENVIEVVAYNKQGWIASRPGRTVLHYKPTLSGERPSLHVLTVGVNQYWDSALKLNYSVPDALALGKALQEGGREIYKQVHVTRLLDKQVNVKRLDAAFTALGKVVKPGDVFVFFIAGHGVTLDGRYYFLPQNLRYTSTGKLKQRAISQEMWQRWFARIPARKSVLLYDTCESGTMTTLRGRGAKRGVEQIAAIERLIHATGRAVISATSARSPALEGYRGHGLFTYTLLEALARGDVNGDGHVELTELTGHIDRRVPDLSYRQFKYRQVPRFDLNGMNYTLSRALPKMPLIEASAGEEGGAGVPVKPDHVVILPARILARPKKGADILLELPAGTMVAKIREQGGFVLIARKGKRQGYVAKSRLAPLR